LYPPISNSGE
jgi:hypothetical protein